jgi:hypothetical protein
MSVSEVLRSALRTLAMAHAMEPDVVTDALLREARIAEADATAALADWQLAADDDGRRRARTRMSRAVAWFGVIVTSTSSNFSRNAPP